MTYITGLTKTRILRERERESRVWWSLNEWAGLLGDYIIGLHLLPEHLTTTTYCVFIDKALPVLLEDLPLATRENMVRAWQRTTKLWVSC
jgi:hypothetical protein